MMSNFTRKGAVKEGISDSSKIDEKTCVFLWTIHDYLYRRTVETNPASIPLQSQAFTADGDDFTWHLEHQRSTSNRDVVLILHPDSDANFEKYSPLSGSLKITLISGDGSWYHSSDFTKASFTLDYNGSGQWFKLYICKEHDIPLGFSTDLYVLCHLEYAKKTNRRISLGSHYYFSTSESQTSLSRDLDHIRTDEDFSDVTISINSKNYPVHKVILAARSSVFKAMLRNDMQESQKNHIVITDIEQETLEEMLRYIYSGKMPYLEEWAFELLPVADKYDLKELKTACKEFLITKLSTDNVDKILILADMHNAEELKANALRFIKTKYANSEGFENTELWKILTEARPSLMKDMLAVFFKK